MQLTLIRRINSQWSLLLKPLLEAIIHIRITMMYECYEHTAYRQGPPVQESNREPSQFLCRDDSRSGAEQGGHAPLIFKALHRNL